MKHFENWAPGSFARSRNAGSFRTRLVDEIDRRAELAVGGEPGNAVPARAEVDAQPISDLPGVFEVNAIYEIDLVQVRRDRDRSRRWYARNDRKYLRNLVGFNAILAEVESAAQNVGNRDDK